ncbi:MAG: 4Fe-4S binding protein [Actinobacteria bacterium]|nr:4Fe-4S binding protein [Actinomycetota bacterium]
MHKGTAAFLYLSPSGSTRKAGREVCSFLEARGYATAEFDIARYRGREEEIFGGIRECSLLLVGSPVYADHAAYPVMSLLGSIPRGGGKPALAYTTYGEVSSGSSVYQLFKALDGKGYRVLGVAEVLAVHSMMFRGSSPAGKGRPNEEDFEALGRWLEELTHGLERDDYEGIDASRIRPGRFDRLIDAAVFNPGFMHHFWPVIRFRPDRCDSCGACQKKCPVGRLDDLPRIDSDIDCLYCYQCVRSCPRGAFEARMWIAHPAIKLFSKASGMRKKHATRTYA